MKRLLVGLTLMVISWSYISNAQVAPVASPAVVVAPKAVAAPVVSPVPAVVTQGTTEQVEQKMTFSSVMKNAGGLQAAVVALMLALMTVMSALRSILLKFEGYKSDGSDVPANKKALTTFNKVCIIGGKILDWLMGNVQH